MPAFNIAQNQQLANPVGAYFQGKAVRLQEQNNERKMQMQERELQMQEDRYKKADEAAAADAAKAIQDGIKEERKTAITDPEIRGRLRGLAENATTPEGTQAWLAELQAVEPLTYEHVIKNNWDKNGDGILDESYRKKIIDGDNMMIGIEERGEDSNEIVEAYQVLSNPEQYPPGSPEAKNAALTVREAEAKTKKAENDLNDKGALVKIYDSTSETGFRWGSREEGLGQPAPPTGGVEFEADGEGGFRFKSGGGVGGTIGAQTAAIKSLAPLQETYANIEATREIMNPAVLNSVLTIPGRIGTVWKIAKEKAGISLGQGDKEALTKASDFMSRSTKVYSDYLFGQGGKNLTKTEKQTLGGMMPEAGESWLTMDFDSITEFETTMKNLQEFTEIAMVRDYIKATNTAAEDLTPEQMESAYPARQGTYNVLRAKMFRDMDVEPWTDPADMSDDELAIYYDWKMKKVQQ